MGNVVNGMLFTGMNNIAGEMQYLHKIIHYSDDPDVLLRTPEGTIEIVSKYLISLIATFNPEQIIIFCDMVYDLTELKKEIAKYADRISPAIILIPGVKGNTGAGVQGVKNSVEQAVGSDILFGGDE